jgi:acyl dehydratase
MAPYFEDFSIGQKSVTAGRTITETDLVNFACLTGDWNEIHTNSEYAEKSIFGRRIAHGALIFSISTGLLSRLDTVDDKLLALFGIEQLRFTAPVYIGDTIRVRQQVEAKDERDEESGFLTLFCEVLKQSGEIVISYRVRLIYQRR